MRAAIVALSCLLSLPAAAAGPFGKIVAKAAYRQTTTTRNLRTLAKIVG